MGFLLRDCGWGCGVRLMLHGAVPTIFRTNYLNTQRQLLFQRFFLHVAHAANATATRPITPKSISTTSPGWTANGLKQVPVVTS